MLHRDIGNSEISRITPSGKIRLGDNVNGKFVNFPYIDLSEAPSVAEAYRRLKGTDKPTEVGVVFISDDVNEVLNMNWEMFKGKRILCQGPGDHPDGSPGEALEWQKYDMKTKTLPTRACLGSRCQDAVSGACRKRAHVYAKIPAANMLEVFSLNINNENLALEIRDNLLALKNSLGSIKGVPFTLYKYSHTPANTGIPIFKTGLRLNLNAQGVQEIEAGVRSTIETVRNLGSITERILSEYPVKREVLTQEQIHAIAAPSVESVTKAEEAIPPAVIEAELEGQAAVAAEEKAATPAEKVKAILKRPSIRGLVLKCEELSGLNKTEAERETYVGGLLRKNKGNADEAAKELETALSAKYMILIKDKQSNQQLEGMI